MMIIKAVVCLVFGLGMLLAPAWLMGLYDMSLGEGGMVMTRLLGASFLLLTVTLGLASQAGPSKARRAISIGVIVGDLIGFVVGLIAAISGVGNGLVWSIPALYLLLALGFAYTQFVSDPDA
jgi:hypothetical protein